MTRNQEQNENPDLGSENATPQQSFLPRNLADDQRESRDQRRGKMTGGQEQNANPDLGSENAVCSSHTLQRPLPLHGSIACICRDDLGRVVDGFTKNIDARSAEQAEATALVETLDFISSKIGRAHV